MFSPSQWGFSNSDMLAVGNQSKISAAYIGNWAAFWLGGWKHAVSSLPVCLFSGWFRYNPTCRLLGLFYDSERTVGKLMALTKINPHLLAW